LQSQFGLLSGGLLAAALGFAKGSASLVSLNGGSFGADGTATSDSLVYALTVTDATFSPTH
jgi:hypothetical protein